MRAIQRSVLQTALRISVLALFTTTFCADTGGLYAEPRKQTKEEEQTQKAKEGEESQKKEAPKNAKTPKEEAKFEATHF